MPLYIRVPNGDSLPLNGPLAVMEATVGSADQRIQLTFTAPAIFADTEPTQLYGLDHTTPQWLEVDATYAGAAREISEDEYRQILRAWFFAQGGHAYDPGQRPRLRNGFSETMENLWEIYGGLLYLHFIHPDLCTNLLFAVHNRRYSQGGLSQLVSIVPRLAELVLYRDNRFVEDFMGSVLMNFVNMRETTYDLCLPWAQHNAS